MPKQKSLFICSECGHETSRWLGRCPRCSMFNTFEEEIVSDVKAKPVSKASPVALADIDALSDTRMETGISELDRVLSGGIVAGSLVLVGGDPGIGKSTLLLQLCENIGSRGRKVLYVSGEESVQQIKLRAKRLDVTTENLLVLAETSLTQVELAVTELKPDLVIIDSIQTMFRDELSNAPGSVVQVRECTNVLMKLGKGLDISIFIVGHVTKDGALAGPRVLEHMVDTVLYFEGERGESYRIVRAVKNRFGSTDEIGVFEMSEGGLKEITNPSEYMLAGRPLNVPGSVVSCSLEGTRPLLIELQALVSHTTFGTPRRMAAGMDYNRVVMLIAILEKRAGLVFANYDSYINIAGGLKVTEPSMDAAAAAALVSSYINRPVDPLTLIFGELGLTGEMRAVTMADKRVSEAYKLGFKQCILPQANLKELKKPEGIRVFGVSSILELVELIKE